MVFNSNYYDKYLTNDIFDNMIDKFSVFTFICFNIFIYQLFFICFTFVYLFDFLING